MGQEMGEVVQEMGYVGQEMGAGGGHSVSGGAILEHLAAYPENRGPPPKIVNMTLIFIYLVSLLNMMSFSPEDPFKEE